MASVSLRTCQASIAKDISDMEGWAKEVQRENNDQGHLDMKFLHARYNRGIARVDDFMQNNHVYVTCDGLVDAQPCVLKFMNKQDSPMGNLVQIYDSTPKLNPFWFHCSPIPGGFQFLLLPKDVPAYA